MRRDPAFLPRIGGILTLAEGAGQWYHAACRGGAYSSSQTRSRRRRVAKIQAHEGLNHLVLYNTLCQIGAERTQLRLQDLQVDLSQREAPYALPLVGSERFTQNAFGNLSVMVRNCLREALCARLLELQRVHFDLFGHDNRRLLLYLIQSAQQLFLLGRRQPTLIDANQGRRGIFRQEEIPQLQNPLFATPRTIGCTQVRLTCRRLIAGVVGVDDELLPWERQSLAVRRVQD